MRRHHSVTGMRYLASRPVCILDFVFTAEGFYSFAENRYIYQYRDHLGNARVSYAKKIDGSLEITDKNDYYPFGLNHIGGSKSFLGSYQNYKYNGKELQETGMYDYGARFYMPDIGRWRVVDPLAEKYQPFSGYNYVLNNPISNIDPDGMQVFTDYKLLKNGEVQRVNPLDETENDRSDTLFATDRQGNVNKNKRITVNKVNPNDESVISGLSKGRNPLDTNLGQSSVPYFSEGFTQNLDDAFNVYNFLDNNTNDGYEFSLSNYNVNGQDNYQIATKHNIDNSKIFSNKYSQDNLVWSVHNHDGILGLDYKNVGNQWDQDKLTMNRIFRDNTKNGLGHLRFFTVNDNNRMIEITRLGADRNKTHPFNIQFLKSLKRVYGK